MQRDLIREWRESYARRLLNLDFKPLSDAPFRTSTRPLFDSLRMVRTTLTPGLTFRDDELVKNSEDAFALLIAQSRNIEVEHQHRALRLAQGDATLLSVCRPGTVGSKQDFSYIAALIPRAELAARVAHVDDLVVQRIPRNSDGAQLLRAYIRSLEGGHFTTPMQARMTIREHIIDLVGLAITAKSAIGETNSNAVVAARLNAAIECITARFDEPNLSVAAVAQTQGVSGRYLQRLLEATGRSFTERVSELRLQRAIALLTDGRDSQRRISDIALDAGFSDVSHFNRLFRSRFGDTPSSIRTQCQKGK